MGVGEIIVKITHISACRGAGLDDDVFDRSQRYLKKMD